MSKSAESELIITLDDAFLGVSMENSLSQVES